MLRDVEEARRPGRRDDHADVLRLPGDGDDARRPRPPARRRRLRRREVEVALQPGLVERLDHRARPRRRCVEHGLSAPGPRRAGRPVALTLLPTRRGRDLPAVRLGRRRADLGVRRHRLQGALPLHRLPRAVRAREGDLMARSTRATSRTFHTLTGRRRSRSSPTTRSRSPSRCPTTWPTSSTFVAGPVADPAPDRRRRRAAAPVLHLRPGRRRARGSAYARSRTACSRGGWSTRCAPATRSRCRRPAAASAPTRRSSRAAGTCASPPAPASRRCSRSPPRVLANPDGDVTLLYGNRTTGSVMFAEELADLKNRYGPQLQLVHVLSPRAPGRRAVLRPARRRPAAPPAHHARPGRRASTTCGCAGRTRCSLDAREVLAELGVPRERVHFELFYVDEPPPELHRADAEVAGRDQRGHRRPRRAHHDRADAARPDDPRRGAGDARRPAVRLQGRRVRHLPGAGHRRRGRHAPQLRARRGRGRARLRADLPDHPVGDAVTVDFDA